MTDTSTANTDLKPETVADALMASAEKARAASGPWAQRLDAANVDDPPSFQPFVGDGADPLARSESMLEAAIGADPTTGGMARGLTMGALTMLSRPVSAITDEYQVARIRELQEAFFRDHGDELVMLSDDLGRAKMNMRLLANMLDQTNFDRGGLDRIMKQKAAMGNRQRRKLKQALDQAKTPEERQKIAAMMADLDNWTIERDERLAAEQPAVDMLGEKLVGLWEEVEKQRLSLSEAASSPGPTTVTGGRADQPRRVLESTHTQPDAVIHAASLHNFLLESRARLAAR